MDNQIVEKIKAIKHYWRVIPSFPLYEVSQLGNVRKIGSEKLMNVYKNNERRYVSLLQGVKYTSVPIGRLVAEAFCGEPIDGKEAHHIDGNCAMDHALNFKILPVEVHRKMPKRRHPRNYAGEIRILREYGVTPERTAELLDISLFRVKSELRDEAWDGCHRLIDKVFAE
jgi:hypothetical protein